MSSWHEDLLNLLVLPPGHPEHAFSNIEHVANKLGFEHVAYGFQSPYPVTKPTVTLLSNYPLAWQEHYHRAGYLLNDPTVIHGKQSQEPLLWSDAVFASNPALWRDALDHGFKSGWAQSSLERCSGAGSLLTLCRCTDPITDGELKEKEPHMRWLVQVAHVSLSRAILVQDAFSAPTPLTVREREVLQWTADGKSAQDIADILHLSKSAVDFHLANSIKKLKTTNKTAAVARAVLLGWLR